MEPLLVSFPLFLDLTKILAIAGNDFCVITADTRISQGFNILSRTHSKSSQLTSSAVITSGGMVADVEALHKNMQMRVKVYQRTFKKEPSLESLAQLLGNTLYSRRFMPYYAFNLLCGINQDGQGQVYGYDAIGSFDKLTYGVQGSGSELGAPILDNQFVGHNHLVKAVSGNMKDAEDTGRDIINSIAERDIYTGDGVEVILITKDGVKVRQEPVRRD